MTSEKIAFLPVRMGADALDRRFALTAATKHYGGNNVHCPLFVRLYLHHLSLERAHSATLARDLSEVPAND